MRPIPLVRGWALLPFVGFLREIGAPVGRWLEASKLSVETLQRPSRPVPLRLVLDFVDRAARAEGADTLAVDVGRHLPIDSLGGWRRLLAGSPTLHDRIGTCSRLMPLIITGLRIWLEVDGPRARLCERMTEGLGSEVRYAEDFNLMLALETIGRAAGPGWKPEAIHLPGRRSERFDRDELFRDVRMVYGARELQVVFSRELLSRPLPILPIPITETDESEEVVQRHAPAQDLVGSLDNTVASMLPRGCPSIDEIAGIANTSVRTLQRRLDDAGLSFRRVVDRVRFRVAGEYLRDPTATVTEIAFQLGYSDSTAFTRAFHRLTGESPTAYQKSLVEG